MAKDDSPQGNGYNEDRKAIKLRFNGIDKALSAHDAKHQHHFHSETEMRALINKARGAWIAIAVISSVLLSTVAAWAAFTK